MLLALETILSGFGKHSAARKPALAIQPMQSFQSEA
jgi:hypothetical protein